MGQSNSPSENYLFLNVMVNFVIVNQKLTGSALHIEKNRTIREKKEIKTEKMSSVTGISRTQDTASQASKSGLRHMFSSVVIPGAQVVFAAIRPNIYLCFVVYEPKKHLRDIHPSVFRTFMM